MLHLSFVFEAMISHLKHQFHGTRGIVRQIVRNLLLAQNSGSFIKKEIEEPEQVKSFIEGYIMCKKENGVHNVGEYSLILPFKNNPELADRIIDSLDLDEQPVHQVFRTVKDNQIFHSMAYRSKGKSCSQIIQFQVVMNMELCSTTY